MASLRRRRIRRLEGSDDDAAPNPAAAETMSAHCNASGSVSLPVAENPKAPATKRRRLLPILPRAQQVLNHASTGDDAEGLAVCRAGAEKEKVLFESLPVSCRSGAKRGRRVADDSVSDAEEPQDVEPCCPAGHKLKEYTSTEDDPHHCDGCAVTFHGGSILHRCIDCDYDLCSLCVKKPKAHSHSTSRAVPNFGVESYAAQLDDNRPSSTTMPRKATVQGSHAESPSGPACRPQRACTRLKVLRAPPNSLAGSDAESDVPQRGPGPCKSASKRRALQRDEKLSATSSDADFPTALQDKRPRRACAQQARIKAQEFFEGLGDSNGEESFSSGSSAPVGSRQARASADKLGVGGRRSRRSKVELPDVDGDPEVGAWRDDLNSRCANTRDLSSAFSRSSCGPAEIRRLPAGHFIGGQPIFDRQGRVNLHLLLGAVRMLTCTSEACIGVDARHVFWLAARARGFGLVLEEELQKGRLRGQGGRANTRKRAEGCGNSPDRYQLLTGGEVRFPTRPPAHKRTPGTQNDAAGNVAVTSQSGAAPSKEPREDAETDLFSDTEDPMENFLNRKRMVMEIRSRHAHQRAQITSLSSHGLNIEEVTNVLTAPQFSYDWQNTVGRQADDDDSEEDGLEVSVPDSENLNRDARRNHLKDDINRTLSRIRAHDLLTYEANRWTCSVCDEENKKSRTHCNACGARGPANLQEARKRADGAASSSAAEASARKAPDVDETENRSQATSAPTTGTVVDRRQDIDQGAIDKTSTSLSVTGTASSSRQEIDRDAIDKKAVSTPAIGTVSGRGQDADRGAIDKEPQHEPQSMPTDRADAHDHEELAKTSLELEEKQGKEKEDEKGKEKEDEKEEEEEHVVVRTSRRRRVLADEDDDHIATKDLPAATLSTGSCAPALQVSSTEAECPATDRSDAKASTASSTSVPGAERARLGVEAAPRDGTIFSLLVASAAKVQEPAVTGVTTVSEVSASPGVVPDASEDDASAAPASSPAPILGSSADQDLPRPAEPKGVLAQLLAPAAAAVPTPSRGSCTVTADAAASNPPDVAAAPKETLPSLATKRNADKKQRRECRERQQKKQALLLDIFKRSAAKARGSMPKELSRLRRCLGTFTTTEDVTGPTWQSYLVDNSGLQAEEDGLSFRMSKKLDDVHDSLVAEWGSLVVGKEVGDGWLETRECKLNLFLPMELRGVPVLTIQAEPSEDAAEALEPPSCNDACAEAEEGISSEAPSSYFEEESEEDEGDLIAEEDDEEDQEDLGDSADEHPKHIEDPAELPEQRRHRREVLRKVRYQARRHARRLRWELEDVAEIGDEVERMEHLGTVTMSEEDRKRWKKVIGASSTRARLPSKRLPNGVSQGAACRAPPTWTPALAAPGANVLAGGGGGGGRQLHGGRGEDDASHLYTLAGTRTSRASFLCTRQLRQH